MAVDSQCSALVLMPPALIGAGRSAIECRLGCAVLAGLVATENCLERLNELANAFGTYLIADGHLSSSHLKPSGCVSKRREFVWRFRLRRLSPLGLRLVSRLSQADGLARFFRLQLCATCQSEAKPTSLANRSGNALETIEIVTLKGRTVNLTSQRFIECARDVAKSFSNWRVHCEVAQRRA